MAIKLHSFVSTRKRYIQVESQPHHLIGIFKKITRQQKEYAFNFTKEYKDYYECEEDGTVTFYQSQKSDTGSAGIWTYIAYECPEGEENIFPDPSIQPNINSFNELLSGHRLVQATTDINEYLKYQYTESRYLDVQLPFGWETPEGRGIADILVAEFQALNSSSVFTEGLGKEYMKAVIYGFIQAAEDVLNTDGTVEDFEELQYEFIKKVKIDGVANLILEYNDYRIWQAALPSQSKAVEHAFNAALNYICRMK
jgi:hypothetical protein